MYVRRRFVLGDPPEELGASVVELREDDGAVMSILKEQRRLAGEEVEAVADIAVAPNQ